MQSSVADPAKFGNMVSLISFSLFKSAAQALENANDIPEAPSLLEINLQSTKKNQVVLAGRFAVLQLQGFLEHERLNSDVSQEAQELIRGTRGRHHEAQLGLTHSYSRTKLRLNIKIQAIALLDQLDKDVSLFFMRVRKWYANHFLDLGKLGPDNHQYTCIAQFVSECTPSMKRSSQNSLRSTTTIPPRPKTSSMPHAARWVLHFLNSTCSTFPLSLPTFVILFDYRKSLVSYISEKMPSTLQILRAEKALFRALKPKGNTPKHGLIDHPSFIGRAGIGYADHPTPKFG
ncbi:hypothetical protein HGRIS_011192 [Hohenbuehelia grisea]|uniref:Nucleolar protein 56 n=1 Tax=Hohenbuehelia grisea TaxID=104357 RepID=A0ABR3JVB6_9AGAR